MSGWEIAGRGYSLAPCYGRNGWDSEQFRILPRRACDYRISCLPVSKSADKIPLNGVAAVFVLGFFMWQADTHCAGHDVRPAANRLCPGPNGLTGFREQSWRPLSSPLFSVVKGLFHEPDRHTTQAAIPLIKSSTRRRGAFLLRGIAGFLSLPSRGRLGGGGECQSSIEFKRELSHRDHRGHRE